MNESDKRELWRLCGFGYKKNVKVGNPSRFVSPGEEPDGVMTLPLTFENINTYIIPKLPNCVYCFDTSSGRCTLYVFQGTEQEDYTAYDKYSEQALAKVCLEALKWKKKK